MTNSVTVNGVTYTDDSDASTGLGNGGARTRLVPMFSNTVIDLAAKQAAALASETAAGLSADASAASAATAIAAPGTSATSTTSLTIGTGTQSPTIQTGKSIAVGARLICARTSDVTKYMIGSVVSYDSGTGALVLSVATGDTNGSGTFTDWTISITGNRGSIIGAVDNSTIGPSIRPTLLCNFAASQYLDPRFTYTMTSAITYTDATGVLQTCPAGQPCFQWDPTTGACLGLRFYEQRTNLALQSADFSTTWGLTTATLSSNATTAPDGTVTADKLIEDATASSQHYVTQSIALSATTYTFSVYAKASTRSQLNVAWYDGVGNHGAYFDLSNCTVGATLGTITSAAITSVGNGWYQCEVTALSAATGSANATIRLATSGNFTYNGDGASGLYLWGAQLEAGAFKTPYIPTTTVAVTRAAPSCSMPTTAFGFNASEGTMVAEYTLATVGQICTAAAVGDGTDNERFELRGTTASSSAAVVVVDGGVTQTNTTAGASAINTRSKLVMSYALNDIAASLNGAAVVTDTGATLPTVTTVRLGTSDDGTNTLNGELACFAYFPKALADAEHIALSTL